MNPTKAQLLQKIGTSPTKVTGVVELFDSHTFHEECYLDSGGMYSFTERLEWECDNKYIVAYIKDDFVIQLFD
jgi:hypothetical protein